MALLFREKNVASLHELLRASFRICLPALSNSPHRQVACTFKGSPTVLRSACNYVDKASRYRGEAKKKKCLLNNIMDIDANKAD